MKNLSKCQEIINIQQEFIRLSSILYHQNYYKLIGIDLSRQTNISIPQQINSVLKLEEDDGAKMFFIAEKQQKTILNFSLDSIIVIVIVNNEKPKNINKFV